MLKRWDDLPDFMRIQEVKPYYELLWRKRWQLYIKRVFDVVASVILIIVLSIPMIIIALLIRNDSKGPIMFRQKRVTAYGKVFYIHKFRTMVENADKIGSGVTISGDSRITRVGNKLRKMRLDELPQLFDVLRGDMSFVGTRPETLKYVKQYKKEYYATLLLPAGVTSEASIKYKDEDELLKNAINVDQVYIDKVLPEKMKYNLKNLKCFSLLGDFLVMIKTVVAVLER